MTTRFEYSGIRVTDMDAAIAFFRDGLGMRVVDEQRYEATKGRAATLVTHEGGPRLELNWYEPGSRHASRYVAGEALDHLGFSLPKGALAPMLTRLQQQGGKLRDEGVEGLVYVDSPDGHTVELWERA